MGHIFVLRLLFYFDDIWVVFILFLFWVMLLKKVLKVLGSLRLFIFVLLLSFSIIVSLRNVFLKIGDLLFAIISCYQKQPFYLIII